MIRHCACGNNIRLRDSLCKNCRIEFGSDPTGWPDWVAYLVHQEQAEVDQQRRHDFGLSIDEEYFSPETNQTSKPIDESDLEEMIWEGQ